MDLFLLITASLCMLIGLVGSLLPILPGPPVCYAGFLLVHFSSYAQFTSEFLIIWAIVVVILGILEYYIPTWGTKEFGGTKAGQRGSFIGTIAGIFFFPPIGLIIGPFLGAYIGEIIEHNNTKKALRSAWGSFIGFLGGTLIKVATAGVMIFFFVQAVT